MANTIDVQHQRYLQAGWQGRAPQPVSAGANGCFVFTAPGPGAVTNTLVDPNYKSPPTGSPVTRTHVDNVVLTPNNSPQA